MILYTHAEAKTGSALKETLSQWLLSNNDFVLQAVQSVESFIKTTEQYKCARPSAEMACDCLAKLCEDFAPARTYALQSGLISVVTVYGDYINELSSVSLAKMHCVRMLKAVFQTSDASKATKSTDIALISEVT